MEETSDSLILWKGFSQMQQAETFTMDQSHVDSCRDTKRYKPVVCGKFLKQKPEDIAVLDAPTIDSWMRQNGYSQHMKSDLRDAFFSVAESNYMMTYIHGKDGYLRVLDFKCEQLICGGRQDFDFIGYKEVKYLILKEWFIFKWFVCGSFEWLKQTQWKW